MIISDFTDYHIDLFREKCNFVGNEVFVFEMRIQGIPIEEIAYELGKSVSGINYISSKVNRKIKDVLEFY